MCMFGKYEGDSVMDGHFVDEVACYSCREVPDMTGEGGCNLSITQYSEALSRLNQQNTSKVMGLDGRRRREEDLTNQTLPEGASGRIQPLAIRNYKKRRTESREERVGRNETLSIIYFVHESHLGVVSISSSIIFVIEPSVNPFCR